MPATVDPNRFKTFYERRNITPLVGFLLGGYYPLQRYQGAATLPSGVFTPQDLDPAAYLADDERLFALHAACPGDMVYGASAFWGVPWMEAALGCPVEADHLTGSSRSHTVAGNGWPTLPSYSADNPWVARCLQMMRAIAPRAAGRYPMAVSLMRGVADVLNALVGLDRLIYGMLDEPRQIEALAEQIADFWIAFGQAQLDAAVPFQGGYGSFGYYLWAPDRLIWLQEDAAALLSPALYERFILPHDRRIATAFPYCLMHLHPARYIPYRPLLDSELAAIELHIDKGGPSARELLPVYREILAHKPLLVWGDLGEDDIRTLLTELPPEGLALQIVVDSPDEAERLFQRYF
jgi:hypothetical protein